MAMVDVDCTRWPSRWLAIAPMVAYELTSTGELAGSKLTIYNTARCGGHSDIVDASPG
jgi:hypothetical protein